MLSFASSLDGDREAFAIFVNDKSHYRDKKNLLSKNTAQRSILFLAVLKKKKIMKNIYFLLIFQKNKSVL